MKLRNRLLISILSATLLVACDPVVEPSGPPQGTSFIAPLPQPRRQSHPSPEVHRWLAASTSVRKQLASLRTTLATLQQFYLENHFDNFLALDPSTLDPAQLCYLRHFLERGYFRIEREIILTLLIARRDRASASPTPFSDSSPSSIAARLQASLQRDETHLIDLETAITGYRAPGEDPFQIPTILTETALAELRSQVTAQVIAERQKRAELDAQAAALRAQP